MNLHEVKIGDKVTFTTEKGKKVKGKVIHRHSDVNKARLMGHVNVQIDDEGSYPYTVHVSKLKKITEETIMQDRENNISDFLQAVLSSENTNANSIFNDLMAEKIDTTLSALKVDVAQHMFATESVDEEYITEEEFEALTVEEQADYEMVELDEAGLVATANKKKKDNWEYDNAQKAIKSGELTKTKETSDSPDPLKAGARLLRKNTTNTSLVSSYRKSAASKDNPHAQQSKRQHAAEIKRPVAYGKRQNFVKMNATAKKMNNEEAQLQEISIKKATDAYAERTSREASDAGYITHDETPRDVMPKSSRTGEHILKKFGRKKGKAALRKADTATGVDHMSYHHPDKTYGKIYNEAIIAPRPTPSPEATAAAKTDIENARKKREAALAAAKAELASASKSDLKKALYAKMYKKEEVENIQFVNEEEHDYYKDYMAGNISHHEYQSAVRDFQKRSGYSHYPKPAKKPEEKIPHSVHINGKKWKSFSSHGHATNVAKKIAAKGQGHKITVEKD